MTCGNLQWKWKRFQLGGEICQKKQCPIDVRHSVVSWGINSSGSRRFRCLPCRKTFTWNQSINHQLNRLSWFQSWLNGASISTITATGRKSSKTIKRVVRWFLKHPPQPNSKPNQKCHLIIDATWFKKNHCLLVYWDTDLKYVQYWRYTISENSLEIIQDLTRLKEQGVICDSITSDGGTGVARAVEWVYPGIPHQRCIVHLQRQGFALLTQHPKTVPGWELKLIVRQLSKISNFNQRDEWLDQLVKWVNKWNWFLKEKTCLTGTNHWWYTHKSLRRARALLVNAIPNMFWYLTDSSIPNTSNGLEGRFSALKFHYKQHRGLAEKRRGGYLSWYIKEIVNS